MICAIGWHDWIYELVNATWDVGDPLGCAPIRNVKGLYERSRTCDRCGRHERNISTNGYPDWRRTAAAGDAGAEGSDDGE